MGVISSFVDSLDLLISSLSSRLSPSIYLGVVMFFFAVLIAITAFIIWRFYRTLSKRNFIHLDLRRYNRSEHPATHKLFAVLLYFVEYILIMPILILLWFVLLAGVLLLLASGRDIIQILTLSGAMIMAIRILAYYNGEISKDLGKLFPFIAMSLFLLTPGSFELAGLSAKLRELPSLFENIVYFLVLIVSLETVMRVVYTISELFKGREEVGEEVEDKETS
jgi:hypothetical protein